MKKLLVILAMFAFILSGCEKEPPKIYLYGESHGIEIYIMKEYELWYDHYHNEGIRHLFIEDSFAGAQLLNMWMQSDDDAILEQLREDVKGTAAYAEDNWEFYRLIKENCPETVFHGTDIEHGYKSTGVRYLEYLEENGKKDSEEYQLVLENIEQGKKYYEEYNQKYHLSYSDENNYREEMMAQNFIREFDSLDGESIMGIYGSSHTYVDGINYYAYPDENAPNMANMINSHYGESVSLFEESIGDMIDSPISVESININGKDYEAFNYGRRYVATIYDEYEYLAFFRVENAYEDFKDFSKRNTDYFAAYDFPMVIAENEVFAIDFYLKNGTTQRRYYIGVVRNGNVFAKELILE